MPTLQKTLGALGAKMARTTTRRDKARVARDKKWNALAANPNKSRYRSFCSASTKLSTLECEVAFLNLELDRAAKAAEKALLQAKKKRQKRTKKKAKASPKRKKVTRKKASKRTVHETPRANLLKAFDALDKGQNWVSLYELRRKTKLPRAKFDAAINELRRDWVLTLSVHEGRHTGPLPKTHQRAGILEPGSKRPLVWASRR